MIVVIPTFNFLGSVLIEFGSNLGKRLLFVPNFGLNNVSVPDSTNLALYKVNFKSSNWFAVQILPFWDLNKLPPRYCFEITTFSVSGKALAEILISPILDIQAS